jgi:hypothetical protein
MEPQERTTAEMTKLRHTETARQLHYNWTEQLRNDKTEINNSKQRSQYETTHRTQLQTEDQLEHRPNPNAHLVVCKTTPAIT